MSFFLKNVADGKLLLEHDFTKNDFTTTPYQSNTFTIDSPFGKTQTSQWCIEEIHISYTEWQFNTETILEWDCNTEIVTMFFNLQGKISIIDTNNNKTIGLYGNQHNIFYDYEAKLQIKVDELKIKWFMVQLSKNSFFKLSNNGGDILNRFANAVTEGKPAIFSDINLPIDFEIQNCINQIIHCPYSDELKPMFLLSKVMEILMLQANAHQHAHTVKSRILKTEYDYERVLFARDYLLKNIDVPPTLPELAKISGINEFKLKKGFKETFSQSVFQYLSNTRLEMAKIHLLEGSKTPTELAFELGYSSPQHFSTAFKKKFRVPPNQARK